MDSSQKKSKFIGIIPARYGSSRFPGKPLAKILGKSLIQRTYENALRCTMLDQVIVATDDKRIQDHVAAFGGAAVMTSPEHPTGTDRLAEVFREHLRHGQVEIIVNIQGDEPCLDALVIQKVIEVLRDDTNAAMSTAVARIETEDDALNPSINKCVVDLNNYALYFSRSLIPGNKTGKYLPEAIYYKHLGIYAYRPQFLEEYTKLAPTPLQQAEDLEQLKVLEHGYRIKTAVVETVCIGVDTPEDIKKVEQFLCKPNTFSSQEESAPL